VACKWGELGWWIGRLMTFQVKYTSCPHHDLCVRCTNDVRVQDSRLTLLVFRPVVCAGADQHGSVGSQRVLEAMLQGPVPVERAPIGSWQRPLQRQLPTALPHRTLITTLPCHTAQAPRPNPPLPVISSPRQLPSLYWGLTLNTLRGACCRSLCP
jgi:hypothetical protein